MNGLASAERVGHLLIPAEGHADPRRREATWLAAVVTIIIAAVIIAARARTIRHHEWLMPAGTEQQRSAQHEQDECDRERSSVDHAGLEVLLME